MVEHADGLPQPQRNWAILTIALGLVMAVMDGAIANVALPTIAKDLHAKPGVFDLDRQWLSVGDHDLAATVSFARRNHRLSPRLPGRAIAVHARIAILRACAHAAADYGGAHHAGLRRDWDHERQRGACPIHLSTPHAWAWYRHQCASRRPLRRGRTDRRGGHSGGRNVAISIRRQRPARPRGADPRLALPAAHHTSQSRL